MSEKTAVQSAGWSANLSLTFQRRAERTVLASRRHHGPLVVQRPFYPENSGCCHTYLLHPPGGMVGGDQLTLDVQLERDAHALLTTPASGKCYRSTGACAVQQQNLYVADNALLEWLPQDTILFDGCQVRLKTCVNLGMAARFIGWDVLCLGRPASAAPFVSGQCWQQFELWRGQSPLLIERNCLTGTHPSLSACWGLAGKAVSGLMVALPCAQSQLESTREVLSSLPAEQGLFSASLLDSVLIIRYLGPQSAFALNGFAAVWQKLRFELFSIPACSPRIWRT